MYQTNSQVEKDEEQGAAVLEMKLDEMQLDEYDDEKSEILKQLLPEPQPDLFTASISEIPVDRSKQPEQDLTDFITTFLTDISNNEKILNYQSNVVEDDYDFEDTIEDFEFREYQLELYQKGIGRNSIIYLETGLGKTLVIIMLMWERMKQFPNKKVVFLANTIQLVEQQAAQIGKKLPRVVELLDEDDEIVDKAKKLGREIKVIHGSKCTDIWNSLMWQIMLDENRMFAMTTQIFLNILRKGHKKIEDFCFIAMDECHSANQDHPYNYILKEFYMPTKQQLKDGLPQIVGATASPVMNGRSVTDEQILKELLQLAANMDSTFLYTDADSVKQHMNEAKIIPVQYQMLFHDPDIQKVIDHRSSYEQCMKSESRVFDIMRKNNYLPEFFQIQDKLAEFKKKYGGNLTLKIIIAQIQKQLLVNGFTMYLELGQFVFILLLGFVIQKLKDFCSIRKQNYEEQQVHELSLYLDQLHSQVKKKYGNIYESCTPKVQKLISLLRQAYDADKNSMILIFVKQRITACFLNTIVQQIITPEYPDIQSDFIIGHCASLARKGQKQILINVVDSGQNDEDELIKSLYSELQRDQSKFSIQELKDQVNKLYIFKHTINFAQQKQILSNFRSGQVKILISTSVAEEGIDIPMCNYVIGFNPITSSKAYVQMKGRARKENSKFMIFMADRVVQQAKVQSHQKVQQNTKKIIEELTLPQRQPMLQKALAKIQSQQMENQFYDNFIIEESGANINTNWSCTLIHQFCQSMILEGGTKAQAKYAIYQLQNDKKKTNGDFLAFLLLPLQLRNFIFYGQKAETVQNAKASAALSAAKQLYQNGYLDVNLKPCINSDFGQHIGADQDDSQIMMTKEQFQIAQQFSARVISKTQISGLKVNSQQRFYHSLHNSLFSSKEKTTEYYQWTCSYRDAQIIVLLTKCFLQSLYDSQSQLKLCGFQFKELTNISLLTYSSYFDDYMKAIIQEENLLQVDEETYSLIAKCMNLLNVEYQIKFESKENKNYLFIFKTNKCNIKLRNIILQLELGLKVQLFKKVIIESLSNRKETKEFEVELQPNQILDQIKDYGKVLTALKYGLQGIPQQRVNYQIIYKQGEQGNMKPLETNLDYIIMNSVDLQQHKPNELILGDSYYKFLIALEFFTNSFINDPKITSSKIKKCTRSTFVRNCLFESHAFLYLHKFEEKDEISKVYIGLKQQELIDELLENISNGKTNKWPSNYRNKIHFSNQEFLQFLQKSLSIIEQNDDNQVNGIRWIECLNLTQLVKYPITEATDLLKYMPVNVFTNQAIEQLKLIYNQFEEKIKYSFNNFQLLFQAMTDVTFKHNLNNQIQQKYQQSFQMKDEVIGVISDVQLQQFQNQFDQMNKIDCSSIENSTLAVLGRSIWNYITLKHLTSILDPFAVRVLGKILTSTQFLAYASIKLKFHEYLNTGVSNQVMELAKQTEMLKDQSVAFHISNQVVSYQTVTLENAFYALVAAIFFDSKCNIRMVQQWQRFIFEKLNTEKLFTKEYIERQPRYKFYVWYQKTFGNPFDFNLIKIPHTDYKKLSQGELLFVPYDMKLAQIVNIKRDKFYDVSQLHIYSKSKGQAWEKLYEIIDY